MEQPRFSIVTATFNTPLSVLEETIDSVLNQTEGSWEWCIADDCSSDKRVISRLKRLSKGDKRIKLDIRSCNGGIVEASNSALALASGEFVAFLDHDDLLTADALEQMSDAIEDFPDVDFLYSDEDKLAADGTLYDLFQKPDFSPERLRGQNYCNHLSVMRKSLIDQVGHFRQGFDGAQDYDLVLRVTEYARRVIHVPQVLYHWRAIEGSTAERLDAKKYAFDSARRAVAEHCRRSGIVADVSSLPIGYLRVDRQLKGAPLVSIVIPTRGDKKSVWGVETCLIVNAIRSIRQVSTYENIEIVVVHDVINDLDPTLLRMFEDGAAQLVWYDKPFNFSDKCNQGAVNSTGEYIVFLNDDTEVISPDWLQTLIGYLQDEEIGAVGPMLLFEDSQIQSAGHGNNRLPHNLGAGDESDSTGLFGERLVAREVSGLTGACMAIRRSVFFQVGGMSMYFPINFNDVDICFKLMRLGYRVIWTPFAKLWHFESLSRDPRVDSEEFYMMERRWLLEFNNDRFTRSEEDKWLKLLIRPTRKIDPEELLGTTNDKRI